MVQRDVEEEKRRIPSEKKQEVKSCVREVMMCMDAYEYWDVLVLVQLLWDQNGVI